MRREAAGPARRRKHAMTRDDDRERVTTERLTDGASGGRVPRDPWSAPYEYQAPGERNPHGFDIWSFGADGQPGGKDADADIGNWSEDSAP